MTEHTGPMENPELAVWVRTERSPETDEYTVTLSVGEDYARTLTIEAALAYALEVLHGTMIADYAAAITQQMHKLGTVPEATAELLGSLAPFLAARNPTDPLQFTPAINRANGEPLLQVSFQGTPLGSWSLGQSREHALGVLEATLAAGLDTAYFHVLTEVIELDNGTASAVVAAVGEHLHRES